MYSRISAALEWRLRKARETLMRWKWDIKYAFSDSEAEEVKSVTLVVVGRNDNYGGDFSLRLKTTIDWNLKHLPNPELIYIEWNTIENRPSDCEWIEERYPNAKCFIVPNEIHQQICDNPKLPVMEYFAKNIGIREASGDWVLLVNADVLMGENAITKIKKLNKKYVYSAHYNNILWDNKPIEKRHVTDNSIVLNYFSGNHELGGLVGNMILAHKDKWMNATGYDESLRNVRAGVDTNGLRQLMAIGAEPMVLGDHYHLDHQESLIHGKNSTHGSDPRMKEGKNIPYKNPEGWGFVNYPRKKTGKRTWQLQKI